MDDKIDELILLLQELKSESNIDKKIIILKKAPENLITISKCLLEETLKC